MRVQQIAKTSMITRKNTQGNLVSFSGKKAEVPQNSMPKFEARTPKTSLNKEKTLFEEIGSLLNDTLNTIKKSYKKSELKKIFVNPLERKWNKFSAKSPKLAQVIKGAGWLALGVGLYEVTSSKLNKIDN